MPAERTAMRQVRKIVRMRAAGISSREIAVRLGIAPSTVRLTMKRVGDAILDRLVHNAHRIDLSGDSMRRTRLKPALRS